MYLGEDPHYYQQDTEGEIRGPDLWYGEGEKLERGMLCRLSSLVNRPNYIGVGVCRLPLHLFTYPCRNDDGLDRHYHTHPPAKPSDRLDECEQGFNDVHRENGR